MESYGSKGEWDERQMAEVFGTSVDNVGLHLKNIYSDGELVEVSTAEDYLVVRTEGKRRVRRTLKHYNLDAVISVGYRVNSKRGMRFRQWATRTLRDHLLQGYTMNERRLAERGLQEARETLALLARTLQNQAQADDTGQVVLDLITSYADTWRLLLEYDEDRLPAPSGAKPATSALDYDRVVEFLALVRDFIVFENDGSGDIANKMAGYHQFHAANVAVKETVRAAEMQRLARERPKPAGGYESGAKPGGDPGDRRVGVVWHTQGSGKSLTMAFLRRADRSRP